MRFTAVATGQFRLDPAFGFGRAAASQTKLSVVNSPLRPAGLAPAWQPASPAHPRTPKLNRGTRKERGLQAASTSTALAVQERSPPCMRMAKRRERRTPPCWLWWCALFTSEFGLKSILVAMSSCAVGFRRCGCDSNMSAMELLSTSQSFARPRAAKVRAGGLLCVQIKLQPRA